MRPFFFRGHSATLILAAAVGVSALALGGCDTYYLAPPAVQITLTAPQNTLVISAIDSTGTYDASEMPLTGTVINSPDTTIIYYVGQDGNYVQGGNNLLGFIDSTGTYTAPLQVPTPNEVTVEAVADVDHTITATTTISLLNPAATTVSITPNVVTQGLSYNLDITGTQFAAGAVVKVSGAQQGTLNAVSSTELKLPVQIQSPGMQTLSVNNPYPFGPTNSLPIYSEAAAPPSSSAVAVLIGQAGTNSSGQAVLATKGYVPQPASLAVVNLDAGKQVASVVMPSSYVPSMVAANPAQGQVVVASTTSNVLQVVDANRDVVIQSYPIAAVTTTTTVDGGTCGICGLVVDSARNIAILDTANGYFSVDLTDGSTTAWPSAPPSANFAYDYNTQRIYAPFVNGTGAGVNVLDWVAGTVNAILPGNGVLFGANPDSAAFDPGTQMLTVGDKISSDYTTLNLNNAVAQSGSVVTPAVSFAITAACSGAWTGMGLDFTTHFGWFVNQGGCVAMAEMPPGAANGVPGYPSLIHWAQVPVASDGLPWANTPAGQPFSLTVYTGFSGNPYGLAVRNDGDYLITINLNMLAAANAPSSPLDANQVDPTNVTVNGQRVSALTYIPLH